MKIENYLKNDRIITHYNYHDNTTEELLSIIHSILAKDIVVEPIFIKSFNREVEFINFGGKNYLILDMNLYEELFNLNKIYFYSQSDESILAHSCKYLSEIFLIYGEKEISKEYYVEYKKFIKNEKYSSINRSWLSSMTMFQFLFLIYHELNHCILNDSPNKYNELKRHLNTYKDLQRSHTEDLSMKDKRSDIDPYTRMVGKVIIPFLEEIGIDPKEVAIKEKSLYSTQYDYMEEIHCDERAAYLVMGLFLDIQLSEKYFAFKIFSNEFSDASADLSSYILLALHYLRYYLRMRIYDPNLSKFSPNIIYTFKRSATRISLFRRIIEEQYFCADNKEGAIFIQDIFRDLNVKFQIEIEDPIDVYLINRYNRMEKK